LLGNEGNKVGVIDRMSIPWSID